MGKVLLLIISATGVLGMYFGLFVALRGKDSVFNRRSKPVKILGLAGAVVVAIIFTGVLVCEVVYFDDLKPRDFKMKDLVQMLGKSNE